MLLGIKKVGLSGVLGNFFENLETAFKKVVPIS